MADQTNIEWCDATFNGWLGCARVHAGCLHCFAEEAQVNRYKRVIWGPKGTRSRTADDYWKQPKKWNKKAIKEGVRLKVFMASQSDFFEDWNGPILNNKNFRGWIGSNDEYAWFPPRETFSHIKPLTMNDLRRDAYKIIGETWNLDWLVLTKRPENIQAMAIGQAGRPQNWPGRSMRRNNVWYGVSVSDQSTADDFISRHLNNTGLGRLLFVSVEPILGPIDLRPYLGPGKIEWVIVGGESGDEFRTCPTQCYVDIVDQCVRADVPVFVKQDHGLKSGLQGRLSDHLWGMKQFPPTLST